MMSKNNTKISNTLDNFKSILDGIPAKNHIRIDACNDFVLPADWGFKDRINTNFHMALCKSGNGSYSFGRHEEKLERGKIFFISSGCRHDRSLDPKNLPRLSLVRFSLIDNAAFGSVNTCRAPFAFSIIPNRISIYLSLFDNLANHYRQYWNYYSSQICNAIISQILFELYGDLSLRHQSNFVDKRLEQAVKHMESGLSGHPDISCLAGISGLSVNYFRNLFQKQYGVNPKAFFIQLKIKRAYELLLDTDYKIKEISQTLGYTDPYAFSKQFKAVTGSSPSEVRNQFSENL